MSVTENQLDQWVRANARDSQGLIVELVWRLIAASVPQPRERRFPLGDSIGQHGPDGRLDTDLGFEPFVPEGRSLWEIGTNIDPGAKATRDYKELVAAVPEPERVESTFVFVTPLSGTRAWEHTWKPEAQANWLDERRERRDWKDVRIIDGTKLVDWIAQFPAVGLWLTERTAGVPASQLETPEQRWDLTKSIGEPPPLAAKLFLANRQEAREKVAAVFTGDTQQAKLDTLFPDQVVDFVCAHLADLEPEQRAEAAARCLIVSGVEAWVGLAAVRQRLVLVADAGLDLTGGSGTTLIQRARRNGHAVIFGGLPGGVPDPTSAPLRSPTVDQVEDALRTGGYAEQRAKSLARRSGGNLGSLLRCVQNLSLLPGWSEDSAAAELAIATLLGAWSDEKDADRAAVERLAGNSYGEWIGRVREAARRPGTPLIHQNARWRFVPRFEGWYALGPRLFDEHLDRLQEVALSVLGERDPQFDLDKGERYAAGIYGKVVTHSRRLRRGLADALALLGSHPSALSSCSLGKAPAVATQTVRTLLGGGDWVRWASVDDVLPLLAEAAPGAFLESLERMLRDSPEVLDALFGQEGEGVTGRSYVTGLLWALETLAWDPAFLGRAVSTLGEMAARDPGGRWANRPSNSLREILLPWLPQTCAPVTQRGAAVETLLREHPAVGWKLVLSLLPEFHSVSMHTRRPAWRPSIPDDWTPGVTPKEYWQQIEVYSRLAVGAAKADHRRLAELVERWANLPRDAQEALFAYLDGGGISRLDDLAQQIVWSAVAELAIRHRKFQDAEWALEPEWINRLQSLANRLAPTAPSALHRRLFNEHDVTHFDERGNYEAQAERLEQRRRAAVAEILSDGGVSAVIAFAQSVDAPWRVGVALGQLGSPLPSADSFDASHAAADGQDTTGSEIEDEGDSKPHGDRSENTTPDIADSTVDAAVLPELLTAEPKALVQFTGGFVRGRHHRFGWPWVDSVALHSWTPAERGQFFAFLPFRPEAWDRAERALAGDAAEYWTRAAVNPYDSDTGLDRAVEALLRHGRPHGAVDCLARLVHEKQAPEPEVITHALLKLVSASQSSALQSYHVEQLIEALQDDTRTTEAQLFSVEWAYLPLLTRHHGGEPKFLFRHLAEDPAFFCALIRMVFRPRAATDGAGDPAEALGDGGDPSAIESGPSAQEEASRAEVDAAASNHGAGDTGAVQEEVAPAIAENAYRLLREWRVPPGSQANGEFDGGALADWMDAMKRDAEGSGHLEVAMTMAGQVLTYAPADPGGLWIHRAAAGVLDAKDAEELRNGYRLQTFNSRGVHWVDPTGKPEDDLARQYQTRADELEVAGFPRLATTLRELATSYAREAERIRVEHRAEV